MSKIVNYTAEILVAITVIFFLWGMGWLINLDEERKHELRHFCINSGMQYIDGNCVR